MYFLKNIIKKNIYILLTISKQNVKNFKNFLKVKKLKKFDSFYILNKT